MTADPYRTLGVRPNASDAEIRVAYRHAVQRHHPDHNNGSAESARRFEEVQAAYARIRELRSRPGSDTSRPRDPSLDGRLADLERELREAQRVARERAQKAVREAAARAGAAHDRRARASDEELGYVRTDDSFAKILADARDELIGRFEAIPDHPATRRAADLIDEFGAMLTGERRRRPKD